MSMPQLEETVETIGGGSINIICRDPAGGLPGIPGVDERHIELEVTTPAGTGVHVGLTKEAAEKFGILAIQGAGYLIVP